MEMRRKRQRLTREECEEILRSNTSGVLSLCGAGMQPYGVPLSYVAHEGKILFHCARAGYKLLLLAENPRASFCVIDKDEIHPEAFTTYFRSVIASGKVREIGDEAGRLCAIRALGERFNPADSDALDREVAQGLKHCRLLELSIEEMSGKQAIELVKKV